MPKTDSFALRVPLRDVGTILYYYHEIGTHGLTVGGCLRDVISQAAASLRESRPELDFDETQAAEIISQLKKGRISGPNIPLSFSPAASNFDSRDLTEAAREVSKEEPPKVRSHFEADIIDD